jgi:hypothetical protein
VEVINSNNCFKCTKNKHFRKRNPTSNKYHWKTKRSRVDEGRERNQEVDKKKINSIFNCKTDYCSLGVIAYIGHNDNASKNIQPELKPVYERTLPRTIC